MIGFHLLYHFGALQLSFCCFPPPFFPTLNKGYATFSGAGRCKSSVLPHVTCWINPHSTDKSLTSPPERVLYRRRRREGFSEGTSLLSDHLGEARTKFVGGLNITSREGFGRPPFALLLVGNLREEGGGMRGHLALRQWAAALCTPAL